MAALLTQLAVAGAFPPEMTDLVAELEEEQLELARILGEVCIGWIFGIPNHV